MEQAASATAIS